MSAGRWGTVALTDESEGNCGRRRAFRFAAWHETWLRLAAGRVASSRLPRLHRIAGPLRQLAPGLRTSKGIGAVGCGVGFAAGLPRL